MMSHFYDNDSCTFIQLLILWEHIYFVIKIIRDKKK